MARCAALINRKHVKKPRTLKRGFIGWFSALPGEDAAVRAMFERAETWLKDRRSGSHRRALNGAAILGVGVRSAAYDEDPIFPFLRQPPTTRNISPDWVSRRAIPFGITRWTSRRGNAKRRMSRRSGGEGRRRPAPSTRSAGTASWKSSSSYSTKPPQGLLEFRPPDHRRVSPQFFDPMKPQVLDPHQMLIGEVNGAERPGSAWACPAWDAVVSARSRGKSGCQGGDSTDAHRRPVSESGAACRRARVAGLSAEPDLPMPWRWRSTGDTRIEASGEAFYSSGE